MRHALLAIAIVAVDPTAVARASQGQPTTPTFGTRVEVLLLDVPVTDATGRPVPDLGPADFVVQVGGKRQRVAAADFVAEVDGVLHGGDTPHVSNNVGADRRLLVIATDVQGDVSSAQRVLSRLAARLDEVHPGIPIGLASLSSTVARVTPGLDRAMVKDALRNELRSGADGLQADAGLRAFDVSLGDSWRIAAGDRHLLQEVQARECADAVNREICGHELEVSVRSAVEAARGTAETAVSRFTAVVEDLGRRPGRKDLLLVTGGWPVDPREVASRVQALTLAAAAADVTVHVLDSSDGALASAEARGKTRTRAADVQLMLGPVESLAAATGGTRVPGTMNPGTLQHLLEDMQSYYRLAIDSSGADTNRGGPVSVRVARKDLRVGRHRQALARRARTAPTTSLAETLSTSIAVSQVELHVASAALFQPEAADRVQHVVSTRVLRAQGPAQIAFLVVDARGQSVDARQAAIEGIGGSGAVFTTALLLPSGRHELRVGVQDAAGAMGTVFHTLDASPIKVGPFEAARLSVLEMDLDTGRVSPLLGPVTPGGNLAARLDVQGAVEPEDVSFALERAGDSESALILAAIASAGSHRWVATGSFPAPAEPGRYLLRATARGVTFEARFDVRHP